VTELDLDVINIAGTCDLLSSSYWKLVVGSDKKKNKVFFVIIRKNLIKTDIEIKIKQNNEGLISIHVRCHEVLRSLDLNF